MSAATSTWLRPSMLPKLALCGRYRSEANAGKAAERGTAMDAEFREGVESAETEEAEDGFLTEAEAEAQQAKLRAEFREAKPTASGPVAWAIATARALAGGKELLSNESALGVEVLGMTGTADLLCAAHWSADLKTGQKRNYREQQAAYALGFMDSLFLDEWTVYLLYCDQEEVETLRFTREEAEKIVREAMANARGDKPPTPNEYCGWCAKRFECPARKEALGIVPFEGPNAISLETATSQQLRDFYIRATVVKDFAKEARRILLARGVKGEKLPGGVSVVNRKGTRKVPHTVIELHLRELGTGDILAAYGSMNEKTLREIWERKLPGKPFPTEQVQEMPGSSYVRVSQPKGAK